MLSVKGDLVDIQQVHMEDMTRLMAGRAGRSLDLPGGIRLVIGYETATLAPLEIDLCPLPQLEGEFQLQVPGETVASGWHIVATRTGGRRLDSVGSPNPLTQCMDYDALGGVVTVRARRPGDRFQPLGMYHAKKLQDFMTDGKVPREWRDRVPLVVSPSGIAWVVGHRIAEWAKLTDETTRQLELRFDHTER